MLATEYPSFEVDDQAEPGRPLGRTLARVTIPHHNAPQRPAGYTQKHSVTPSESTGLIP